MYRLSKNGIEKLNYHAHCELTALGVSTGLGVIGENWRNNNKLVYGRKSGVSTTTR
jgi:hypothetical protein